MQAWTKLASERVLETPWFTVRSDRCRTPAGGLVDPYYVVETSDWVHVVAQAPDGRVLLVRQYRHAVGLVVDELPGGVRDAGETPLETARRELREETGAVSDNWIQIASVHPDPARQANRVWTFLARDIRFEHATSLDEHEEVEPRLVPRTEVDRLIAGGSFSQSTQIAGYLLALRHLGGT